MRTKTTALVFSCLMSIDALALSCMPNQRSLEENYAAADSIIVAIVSECKVESSTRAWVNGGNDCRFDTLEVLKESKPARDYRGVFSSSACGMSLRVGEQYLLFLDAYNRPVHGSTGLTGISPLNRNTVRYPEILRAYRDGVISDLSEPWEAREMHGSCVLSQKVGGHQLWFSRWSESVSEEASEGWLKTVRDGKTIYTNDGSTSSSLKGYKLVIEGDSPDYAPGSFTLAIRILESRPVAVRTTTISVGSKTWALFRRTATISGMYSSNNSHTEYVVGGDAAEEILAAMEKPSEVVVSAVLEKPAVNPAQTSEPESQPRSGDSYLMQAPPNAGFAKPSNDTSARPVGRSPSPIRQPEQEIRIETRTTQLPRVIDEFRACNE